MLKKMLDLIGRDFPLTETKDAARVFEAAGMNFEARGYEAEGFGHIGMMTARGPMKLETLILNPFFLDAPIFSYDRIHAMGQEVLLVEMYDSLLGDSFRREEMLRSFGDETPSRENAPDMWYTPLMIRPGLSLKGTTEEALKYDERSMDFFTAYLTAAKAADSSDPVQKKKKAAAYSEGLLEHGGPATDPVKAAIGAEETAALFRMTLFGV